MTVEQKQKIPQMRNNGLSYSQIASTLNIFENTVKSFCRRNNLGAEPIIKLQANTENKFVCKQCEKPLEQRIKGQQKKFCSENCRRTWWKNNDNMIIKNAFYTLTCVACGQQFESYGNKNRKYCKHSCYIAIRFKKGGDGFVT